MCSQCCDVRNSKVVAAIVAIAVGFILVAVGLSLGFTAKYFNNSVVKPGDYNVSSDRRLKGAGSGDDFDPAMDILEYFNLDDGLAVTWYHAANSHEKLEEALDTTMMIEGDIMLRWVGLPNQTEEPIMAHPPDVDSDLTFEEWITGIMATPERGMKLDFKLIDAVPIALKMLADKSGNLQNPVWINADIVTGPGGGTPIDGTEFLSAVNTHFPTATLSLGWTTAAGHGYTREHMEDMWKVCVSVTQPVTLPARLFAMTQAWNEFRWLLSKDPDKFTITVWSAGAGVDWEGATPYDLLLCRNDIPKSKIFYDLVGDEYPEFLKLVVTAGTPLNHFAVPWDGAKIKWTQNVNTLEALKLATEDNNVMMIECDVTLSSTDNTPVMGLDGNSGIAFESWLQHLVTSTKGVKVHLRKTEVVEPVMQILATHRDKYQQPIWIHADMLEGPNMQADASLVDPNTFSTAVKQSFPYATVSIGWSSVYDSQSDNTYTNDMIEAARNLASQFVLPVTFAAHAGMAKDSWEKFQNVLLSESRGYTVTLFAAAGDSVDPDDLKYIRENSDSEIGRVFYDVPSLTL